MEVNRPPRKMINKTCYENAIKKQILHHRNHNFVCLCASMFPRLRIYLTFTLGDRDFFKPIDRAYNTSFKGCRRVTSGETINITSIYYLV